MHIRSALSAVAFVALGAVLAPAAGHAAGTLMTLVDSDSATQAQVDGDGRLRVGDGTGPLTVDGTVSTRRGDVVTKLLDTQITPTSQSVTTLPVTSTAAFAKIRVVAYARCANTYTYCDASAISIDSIAGTVSTPTAVASLAKMSFATIAPRGRTPGSTLLIDLPGPVIRIGASRVNANSHEHPTIHVIIYGDHA